MPWVGTIVMQQSKRYTRWPDRHASFGFIRLEKKSAALLQALRGNQDEEITELRYEVTTEYIRIVHAIRSLASELGIFM